MLSSTFDLLSSIKSAFTKGDLFKIYLPYHLFTLSLYLLTYTSLLTSLNSVICENQFIVFFLNSFERSCIEIETPLSATLRTCGCAAHTVFTTSPHHELVNSYLSKDSVTGGT